MIFDAMNPTIKKKIDAKQDQLVAGDNIQIDGVIISAKQDKLTAGTGLEIDGTTINHSNSVTAQTSYVGSETDVPRIQYDAQGHITAITTAKIYPPTTVGTEGQVWRSDGFGAGAWETPDTTPTSGSTKLVTSEAVFTQLATKQATITGGASTIALSNLTPNMALVSNGSGKVAVSSKTTSAELEYLSGVKSSIQSQIDTLNGLIGGGGSIEGNIVELLNKEIAARTEEDEAIREIVSNLPKFAIEIVATLPTTNISPSTLYLIEETGVTGQKEYVEYIYVNSRWEKLGTFHLSVDSELSPTSTNPVQNKVIKKTLDDDYYTKGKVDELLGGKLNKSGGAITGGLSIDEGLNVNGGNTVLLGNLNVGGLAMFNSPVGVFAPLMVIIQDESVYDGSEIDTYLGTTAFLQSTSKDVASLSLFDSTGNGGYFFVANGVPGFVNKTGSGGDAFAFKSDIPKDYIVSGSQTTTSSSDGGDNVYTFTRSNGTKSTFTVKNGSKGSPGVNGADGAPGAPGVSAGFGTPTATVDANTGTPSVTVSASGPDTAKVFNFAFSNLRGKDGTDGKNGNNGVSCTHSWSGTTLNITSASGTSSANLKGADGVTPTIKAANGANVASVGTPSVTASTSGTTTTFTFNYLKGETGVSAGFGTPTATVDAGTDTPSVTVTATGPNTAKVFNFAFKNLKGKNGTNGANGKDGSNGVSCTHSWNGTTLTITSASGTSSANLRGPPGPVIIDTTVTENSPNAVSSGAVFENSAQLALAIFKKQPLITQSSDGGFEIKDALDNVAFTMYPPTTAGTAGQIWVSDGSGPGVWKDYKVGTEISTGYAGDAKATKDTWYRNDSSTEPIFVIAVRNGLQNLVVEGGSDGSTATWLYHISWDSYKGGEGGTTASFIVPPLMYYRFREDTAQNNVHGTGDDRGIRLIRFDMR